MKLHSNLAMGLPCSTSIMISVPVKVLLIDPVWNNVSAVTGSGCSTLVMPNPDANSWPPPYSPVPSNQVDMYSGFSISRA